MYKINLKIFTQYLSQCIAICNLSYFQNKAQAKTKLDTSCFRFYMLFIICIRIIYCIGIQNHKIYSLIKIAHLKLVILIWLGIFSRKMHAKSQSHIFISYVVSRWYRPPQLILGGDYSSAIDIWSAGCILAQLIGRTVLFKGNTILQQFQRIMAVMGTPNKYDIPSYFQQYQKSILAKAPFRQKIQWSTLFSKSSPTVLDLLDKMLVYNPRKRLSAKECLQHSFFQQYKQKIQIKDIRRQLDWNLEQKDLSLKQLRKLIFKQSIAVHPNILQSHIKSQKINDQSGQDRQSIKSQQSFQ